MKVFTAFGWTLLMLLLAAPTGLADDAAPAADEKPAAAQPAAKDDADETAEEPPIIKVEPAAPAPKSGDGKSKSAASKTQDPAAARREADEYLELYKSLADTIDQVERNYVKPVDRRELMEAAIKGVLTKLDPYSSYIDRDEMSGFRTSVESQFGGIGIQITVDEGRIKVTSPLVGTPAYRAGVQAGDWITQIEGESTRNMPIDDAVKKLKGAVDTSVTFTVQHALSGKSETFTLKREIVHVDTVLGDSRNADDTWNYVLDADKRIGYIRLTSFSRDTARDLRKAVRELERQKLRGLILDLRFNPGGLLTSATEVADLFVADGRIVSTSGRNVPERVWDAVKPGTFDSFPMVVLVNRYSASASEIVAACLQDHNRAVVIGERTWGKGSVQNVVELEEGKSALKLTTATYTRPNGHNIHRFPDAKETDEWGVKPNDGFEVRLDNAEMAALLASRRERDVVQAKIAAAALEKSPAATDADQPEAADKAKADASAEKSPAAPAAEKSSKDEKPDAPPADPKTDGDASKPAPRAAGAKSVDRQLQKGLDYLTTELARAP